MKRAFRNLLKAGIVTTLLVHSGASGAFGLGDIKLPGQSEDTSKASGSTNAGGCVQAGAGGDVGLLERAKAMVMNQVIDAAMKNIVGVEGVFLIQEKIADTCMADKYLGFADRAGDRITRASVDIINNMAGSIKTQEARVDLEAAAHSANQDFEEGNSSDAVADVGGAIESFNKLLEGNAAVDKEKLAAVWVDVKNLGVRDVELLSLAKHIGNFAKDNVPWALKNAGKLKSFLGFAKSLSGQAQAVLTTPALIASRFSKHDKKLLERAKKKKKSAISKPIASEEGLEELE